jgi:hypothetical protein
VVLDRVMNGRTNCRSCKEGETSCDVCQPIIEGNKESEDSIVVVKEEEEEEEEANLQ